MNRLLLAVLLTIKLVNIFSQSCKHMTKEVQVRYNDSENMQSQDWTITSIEGCINKTSFDIKNVQSVGIWCGNVGISKLEKFFINNMEFLKYVYIAPCNINSIESGAFMNLPQLKKLTINGNYFTKIPAGLFNTLLNLQSLIIFNNEVSEIEDYAFANLTKLQVFSLALNKLSQVKQNWFTNTSHIEQFGIFRNSIRKIPLGMFHGWKDLQVLDLSANLISTIEGPLLNDSGLYLNFVGLHLNKLRTVSTDLFTNSIIIEHLVLSGNLFNYLPEKFLNNVQAAVITISANPFSCPCLEKVNQILLKRHVVVYHPEKLTTTTKLCQNTDVPVCGYSLNSSSACVEAVDKDLTNRIIARMKEVQYDTVIDENGQQCAMFDNSD